MEGLSIIIPVFNKLETTVKCVNFINEHNKDCSFEIIVVDNGSTDETPRTFEVGAGFKPALDSGQITYIRNEQNLGVAKALNIGAKAAKYDVLCFMHNDVFVFREGWTGAIHNFISTTVNAGVAGLYGAKTLRKDGSFRGRTIVHAKKDSPAIKRPFEKVAVVDGLLMAMSKTVFEKIGGFHEDFRMHYYDKDISMRAVKDRLDNYVLNIAFEHACGTTREQIKTDDSIRDEAQEKFIEIWKHSLPVDVSTWRERIGYLLKKAES
ncbi:MAG: glycosyltransferase [Nitrospirae bacterium]|nr:glycosyltransferase [Nitrospirota bacterium]